jgi:hypothetical protein
MTTDKMKHYLGTTVYNFITREADKPQLERCKKMVESDISILPDHESIKFLRTVELQLINYMLQ